MIQSPTDIIVRGPRAIGNTMSDEVSYLQKTQVATSSLDTLCQFW